MKYIRTKDGIYTLVTKDEPIYELNGKKYYCVEERISSFVEDEVIKQADTIEELCDEFILLDSKGIPHRAYISERDEGSWFYLIDEDIYLPLDCIEIGYKYYGAIWTDKGLIYVAKLNEKGDLELL